MKKTILGTLAVLLTLASCAQVTQSGDASKVAATGITLYQLSWPSPTAAAPVPTTGPLPDKSLIYPATPLLLGAVVTPSDATDPVVWTVSDTSQVSIGPVQPQPAPAPMVVESISRAPAKPSPTPAMTSTRQLTPSRPLNSDIIITASVGGVKTSVVLPGPK